MRSAEHRTKRLQTWLDGAERWAVRRRQHLLDEGVRAWRATVAGAFGAEGVSMAHDGEQIVLLKNGEVGAALDPESLTGVYGSPIAALSAAIRPLLKGN